MSGCIDSKEKETLQKRYDTVAAILMSKVAEPSDKPNNKITIVGAGHVGMACAISLLTQNVTNDIALVDVMEDKVKGEMMDIQQASCFLDSPKIQSGSDFTISANSRICVVTTASRQTESDNSLDLQVEMFLNIIPPLVLHSPDAVILVVSDPVDILTYVACKLSGLPSHRVIGAGTNLDSSRLRFLVSQKLDLGVESCHGWVIGEHGDSSVAVWSGVNVAGVRLPRHPLGRDFLPEGEPDCFSLLHQQVIDSAHEVVQLKGYISWAVGLSVSQLCNAIVNNVQSVHAVSTAVKGLHGIKHDIFLSLPCTLGDKGVSHVIIQPLKDVELQQLRASADKVQEVIEGLHF